VQNRRNALKQLTAFFERRAAPCLKSAPGEFDCALSFGNTGFGNRADDLLWSTRIDRRQKFLSPDFFTADGEWIFLTEAATHTTQSSPHFFLRFAMDEVHQRRVFVSVAGRSLPSRAIARKVECGFPCDCYRSRLDCAIYQLVRVAQQFTF